MEEKTSGTAIGDRFRYFVRKIISRNPLDSSRATQTSKTVSISEVQPVDYEERFKDIDPEIAREQTKAFSNMADGIMSFYLELHSKTQGWWDDSYWFGGGLSFGTSGEHKFYGDRLGMSKVFRGLGDGSFYLWRSYDPHDDNAPGSYFGKLLGMDGVPHFLEIGLHTDEQTRDAMEELGEKDSRMKLAGRTIYVFDEAGRLGKLITLPRAIEDSRPVADPDYFFSADNNDASKKPHVRIQAKLVPAEIQPGEFEVIGYGLSLLNQKCEFAQRKIAEEAGLEFSSVGTEGLEPPTSSM